VISSCDVINQSKVLCSFIFPMTIILITINLLRETQIFTSLFPRKFLINILRSFLLCIININSHIFTVITFIVISYKLTYRFLKVTISTVVNFTDFDTMSLVHRWQLFGEICVINLQGEICEPHKSEGHNLDSNVAKLAWPSWREVDAQKI